MNISQIPDFIAFLQNVPTSLELELYIELHEDSNTHYFHITKI